MNRVALLLAALTLPWVAPLQLSAQPPPPDLIFSNGFELPNQPPIADAGNDQTSSVGVPLTLDGSGSSDPNGDPLYYAWSVLDRPTSSGAELFDADQVDPILIADRAGDYVLQLIVSDGELFSEASTVTITASGTLAASATIGPAGGAVGLPDGASVLIPPNALNTSTLIGIVVAVPPNPNLPDHTAAVGDVYQMTPEGQSFARPVQVTLPYDPDLLPAGYSEGAIAIYRHGESQAQFDLEGRAGGDPEEESSGQLLDTENDRVSVLSYLFSRRVTASSNIVAGYTATTLTEPTASVVIHRPAQMRTQRPVYPNCDRVVSPGVVVKDYTMTNLSTRMAGDVGSIVLHSTNSGNVGQEFRSALAWGANRCTRDFAHYYIDRNGRIYQVADDLIITLHTATGADGISNSSAIGIELFLNVGEPYDGRQISAMIRLVDFLAEKYSIPRPERDPNTGIYRRNRSPISTGGDRFVGHTEVWAKCDPSGTFMNSGIIKPEYGLINCSDPDPRVSPVPLSVGDSRAPALIDVVTDAIVVLQRDGQHTGIVNTQGGDGFDLDVAGHGGAVSFEEDADLVALVVGPFDREYWQENDPNAPATPPAMAGPGPLIVAAGATASISGPDLEYTDVIVAGTLNITGPLQLRLTGSFYMSPVGKIIARDGRDGADLTVYSRGVPIVQGLIDSRGVAGDAVTPGGGQGGDVRFIYATPGVLLLPTLYTRGGDADFADVTLPGGGPKGGNGGAITVTVEDTHVFLGGGIGPAAPTAPLTQLPPYWHAPPIDVALMNPPDTPARWSGDYLPPPPPFNRYAVAMYPPAVGERQALRKIGAQAGVKRGLITSGGMGGAGIATVDGNQHGGAAGDGGAVQITLGTNGVLTLRDADIATGTEVETVAHRFRLPPPSSTGLVHSTCTATGAHGGFGIEPSSGGAGNGGPGGAAGAVTIIGGAVSPSPVTFNSIQDVWSFAAIAITGNPACARGTSVIGQVIEVDDANGRPLYRVRIDQNTNQLLGGHGGIASGRQSGFPGNVGPRGSNAALTGLPVQ